MVHNNALPRETIEKPGFSSRVKQIVLKHIQWLNRSKILLSVTSGMTKKLNICIQIKEALFGPFNSDFRI